MKIEIYEGFDDLSKQLYRIMDRVNNAGVLEKVLNAGARPLIEEVKTQIRTKAKYDSPKYKGKKAARRGQLIAALKTEMSVKNYWDPYIKIGFTKKGSHSNILENSRLDRGLKHLEPAWDLRKEEAMNYMLDEAFQALD